MQGVNATTGKDLSHFAHIEQSVRDILSTRVGTRVMRRDYGSDLPVLLDAPLNQRTLGKIRVAAVEALEKWEPRLKCNEVKVSNIGSGFATFDLTFTYLVNGSEFEINNLRVGGN